MSGIVTQEQASAALRDFQGNVTTISASVDEQYYECEIDVLTVQTIRLLLKERASENPHDALRRAINQGAQDAAERLARMFEHYGYERAAADIRNEATTWPKD